MLVDFDSLGSSARVWIYQAGRKFSETEKNTISQTLSSFTDQWAAHGSPLKTSFKVFHDQFIVLTADESFNEASGCSIDSSVHVIKKIDDQFSLDLFDRTKVAFLKKNNVMVLCLNDLSKGLSENMWQQDTLTFNNTVSTKGELDERWVVPANETWLKRYLTKIVV